MKKIMILAILFGLFTGANSQQQVKQHFVRVYNAEGKKIAKGRVQIETETTLILTRGQKTIELPMSDLSKIKNGRSAEHYISVGSIAVIVPLAIAAVIFASTFTLTGPLVITGLTP